MAAVQLWSEWKNSVHNAFGGPKAATLLLGCRRDGALRSHPTTGCQPWSENNNAPQRLPNGTSLSASVVRGWVTHPLVQDQQALRERLGRPVVGSWQAHHELMPIRHHRPVDCMPLVLDLRSLSHSGRGCFWSRLFTPAPAPNRRTARATPVRRASQDHPPGRPFRRSATSTPCPRA
jgi:hypothetical protein